MRIVIKEVGSFSSDIQCGFDKQYNDAVIILVIKE